MAAEVDGPRRATFARFLERLAAHEATAAEWADAIVQHYQDDLLESVRRECARLLYDVPDRFRPGAAERGQLQAWARALAASSGDAAAG